MICSCHIHINNKEKGGKKMILKRLEILVIMKPFWNFPKHAPKIDMIRALETYANVNYWYTDGHIKDILKTLAIQTDFIFHYEIAWNYVLAYINEGFKIFYLLIDCLLIDNQC